MPSDSPGVQVADYAEVLRRRWRLVAAGVVLGLALALLALVFFPKSYISTASVIVASTGEDSAVANGRTSTELNLDTEAQIVSSNVVARAAVQQMDGSVRARDAASQVRVTVPPNTSVLHISFTAPSAERAQVGADSFAAAYLEHRKGVADARIERQVRLIGSRTTELNRRLRAIGGDIAGATPLSGERTYQAYQRNLLVNQLSTLNAKLTTLSAGGTYPGSVITSAQLPRRPSDPNPEVLAASALLAGLLLGLLAALLAERTDTRVRDRRDLIRLGLDPLVGRVLVPAVEDAAGISWGDGSESLRQLRNALLARVPMRKGPLLVASASRGTSGSSVAISFAVAVARSGSSVILVAANSEQCAVTRAFGLSGKPGLVDVLDRRKPVEAALRRIEGAGDLRVLAAGVQGLRFSDLLQGSAAHELYASLCTMADYVIVDVAPMAVNADAQTVALSSGAVLLVATALQTTRGELSDAVDQLDHVSANLGGAIVVDVVPSRVDDLLSPPAIPTTSPVRGDEDAIVLADEASSRPAAGAGRSR